MSRLGEWDLLDVIGVGGSAVVHRAVHRDRPGRVVAIKRLRDVDPAGVAALRREAEALDELAHPAIAVLHEVVVDGDEVALVLALATGGSLAQRVSDRGRLPANEVVDLGRRLANALAAAHDVGVLHRDVSPANVLYGREDEPRLADFGLAAAVDVPPDEVAGTSTYLDPEVAHGAPPGPASDTWGLAVVLWEALAGQPPWMGADDLAVRRAADRGLHLPLDQLVPEAPMELVEVLERGIARDPRQRYRHAQELEMALAGVDLGEVDAGSDAPTATPVAPHVAGAAAERGSLGAHGQGAAQPLPADDPGETRADVVTARVAGWAPAPRGSSDAVPARASGSAEPGVVGGPPDTTTTVFGRRPPPAEPDQAPDRSWLTRALVVVAVVVPLAIAVATWWVVSADRVAPVVQPSAESSAEAAAAGPTGTPSAPPTASRTGREVPSPTIVPSARGSRSSQPTSEPTTAPTVAGQPRGLPAGWAVRVPPPRCDGDDGVPEASLAADVDGSGCAVLVGVAVDVDDQGNDALVLQVPASAGAPAAGRFSVGAPGDGVVLGDWDGDGVDTPAVVRADSGVVFAYPTWEDDPTAIPTGQTSLTGLPAVATDPGGTDHVVEASSLPDPAG